MKASGLEHYDISLLYVEDERVTREQVSRILQRIVTELYVAENGQEGLKLYQEKRPDIILTDIMMPVMDGLEMCREIRRLDRESQLIMLTPTVTLNICWNASHWGSTSMCRNRWILSSLPHPLKPAAITSCLNARSFARRPAYRCCPRLLNRRLRR